jgi:bifunctional DNA-binding transcriptional regulator/antitoxin component of YhaV-PrlF toxin-antitoxin module
MWVIVLFGKRELYNEAKTTAESTKGHLERMISNAKLHYNRLRTLPMAKITVTARGQVTFRKKVLEHLGIKAGEKIELDLLPDGRGMIRAAKRSGTIEDFIGRLAGKTKKVATLEEINEAAANGWAGIKGRK